MEAVNIKHSWRRAALLLLVLTSSCNDRKLALTGSRSAAFGPAELMSEYRRASSSGHEVALLHVLFVPVFDTPAAGGYGSASASSGTVDKYVLDYSYFGPPPNEAVRARPVTIRNGQTVAASDRSFELAVGNVFVARVAADGTVELSQLHITRDAKDVSADSVLADIKASFRNDARIQSLKPHQ